jgi:hypothetical protein
MKSIGMTLAMAALGITATLASPAFAKKAHHATSSTTAYSGVPIPGYDKDGGVIAIPNTDAVGK